MKIVIPRWLTVRNAPLAVPLTIETFATNIAPIQVFAVQISAQTCTKLEGHRHLQLHNNLTTLPLPFSDGFRKLATMGQQTAPLGRPVAHYPFS